MKHNLLENFKKKDYENLIDNILKPCDSEHWRSIFFDNDIDLYIFVSIKDRTSKLDKTYTLFLYDDLSCKYYEPDDIMALSKECEQYMKLLLKHELCVPPKNADHLAVNVYSQYIKVSASLLYKFCKALIKVNGADAS